RVLRGGSYIGPRATLERFSSALATRGPDASGVWLSRSGAAGLAHRRLSIIDLDSRSDQPMQTADGQFTISFNGEIYNYRELRAELEKRGRNFRTTSDTEVLLAMYAEYGAAMLPRLRGMFAFGLWDEAKQELILARDAFGIKPLYYAEGDGHLYFASQVRALVPAPGVDLREEPAGTVGFFVWGSVPEPYTLYRGIHCLPSGSWMRVTQDGIAEQRVFATPVGEFGKYEAAEMPRSREEMLERLHIALEESVRMHEIADVPVAVFLSAGIDSGAILALAVERGQQVEALTLGFDALRGAPQDETGGASEVARHYGVAHDARYIDRELFLSHRERLLAQMDQPTIDGVNTYFVSWLAREHGFKVALSGLGGDEMFGGYPSFGQIPKMVHGLKVTRSVPWVGRAWRIVTAPMIERFTSPKYASLFEYGGSWGGAYLLRRGLYMPWELPEFLDPEVVRTGWRELQSVTAMSALAGSLDRLPGTTGTAKDFLRVSALEMSFYMRTQLLRDADWAGMAHSVEIRVPLVDMTLLRQVSPLRASQFAPRKPGFVDCLPKRLPENILKRPKSGFNIPVREWMQVGRTRGLRSWASDVYDARPEKSATRVRRRVLAH
ncbi:MAG: asparagine synthase (glutamine-hydrolyzing), partial [Acidobacteriaceae bacterium]